MNSMDRWDALTLTLLAMSVGVFILWAGLIVRVDEMRQECLEQLEAVPTFFTYMQEYPVTYYIAKEVSLAADRNDIPEGVAFALVYAESRFNPLAEGGADDRGLTQITPITARHMGVPHDAMWDARLNLETGFRYLNELHRRYGDLRKALVAYNLGPTALDKCWPECYVGSIKYADSILTTGRYNGTE